MTGGDLLRVVTQLSEGIRNLEIITEQRGGTGGTAARAGTRRLGREGSSEASGGSR